MKVTLTQPFKKVVFTWNDELTNCSFVALGATDDEIQAMVAGLANEGVPFAGWDSIIEL